MLKLEYIVFISTTIVFSVEALIHFMKFIIELIIDLISTRTKWNAYTYTNVDTVIAPSKKPIFFKFSYI